MSSKSARTAVSIAILVVLAAPSSLAKTSSASVSARFATLALDVRDPMGRPIPARARVVPLSLSERVRLGLWGDVRTITDARGGELRLPAGDYQLIVSRGPEWSLARQRVKLAPGAEERRVVTLTHQVSVPGFRGADLHVHTDHSSDAHAHGGVSGAALRAEGVELAVGTDHNRIGGLDTDIDSVAGSEITTWDPEVGHFNAFPLRRLPTWRGTSPARLFAELARDPEVFVQVNHPRLDDHIAYFALGGFDGRGFARKDFTLDVDGLEVWNGYEIAQPSKVERLLREWRSVIARGRRLTATGGSDSHGAPRHPPGYPRTYVQASSAAGMARALKEGRAFVTNGPLLSLAVQGRTPGETAVVPADGSVSVELAVHAADWLSVERAELWAGDRLVWTQPIAPARSAEPLRFVARVRVDVRGARTLHAVARGGSGLDALLGRSDVTPLAFTNPVYLRSGKPASH